MIDILFSQKLSTRISFFFLLHRLVGFLFCYAMIKIKRNPLTNESRVVKMSKYELLLHNNIDPFPCKLSEKIDKLQYPKKFKNLLGNKNV